MVPMSTGVNILISEVRNSGTQLARAPRVPVAGTGAYKPSHAKEIETRGKTWSLRLGGSFGLLRTVLIPSFLCFSKRKILTLCKTFV